jgi:NAD(P)-dependent dehydrogenase (short-subunit alcohol dehydrogenase family)
MIGTIMKQKNIVITGANSGIGLATAKLYLAQGHHVTGISRNTEILKDLSHQFDQTLHVIKADIIDINAISDCFAQIKHAGRKIDVLVANAGIAVAEAFKDVTPDSFDETFDINVKGVFFTVQKAIDLLEKYSSVVIVSSIQANKGAGLWSTYGASKAAVRSLTRSFAEALAHSNVRVNCISPGVTRTPIFDKFGFDKNVLESVLDSVMESTPLKRLGTPEEIADVIEFLSSEKARFMTGADVQVDGGLIQI